jgi:hypothetical protein
MSEQSLAMLRAKERLQNVRHASMATVNQDGSPHNTPFYFLHDEALTTVYWGSHPESQHSQNILRTGQLFIAVYDAKERGGLYIRAERGQIVEGKEFASALLVHNASLAREGKRPIEASYYQGDNPQRMWSADITGLWINAAERDEQGKLIKDYRIPVSPADLLA